MAEAPAAATGREVGGVVFRASGELFFLPATIAVKLLPTPVVARVPGAPAALVGVALVEGEVVPVIAVSDGDTGPRRVKDSRPMLVCSYSGERAALVGLEVVATGRFEAAAEGEGVVLSGRAVKVFDVGGVFARLREGRWAV